MSPTQHRILAALQYYGPLTTSGLQEKLRMAGIPLSIPALIMEASEMIARYEIRRSVQLDGTTLYVSLIPVGRVAS